MVAKTRTIAKRKKIMIKAVWIPLACLQDDSTLLPCNIFSSLFVCRTTKIMIASAMAIIVTSMETLSSDAIKSNFVPIFKELLFLEEK